MNEMTYNPENKMCDQLLAENKKNLSDAELRQVKSGPKAHACLLIVLE